MRLNGRVKGLERRTGPARCPWCGEPVPCPHELGRREGKAVALRILAVPAALEAALALDEALRSGRDDYSCGPEEEQRARIASDPALAALEREIGLRLAEGGAARR